MRRGDRPAAQRAAGVVLAVGADQVERARCRAAPAEPSSGSSSRSAGVVERAPAQRLRGRRGCRRAPSAARRRAACGPGRRMACTRTPAAPARASSAAAGAGAEARVAQPVAAPGAGLLDEQQPGGRERGAEHRVAAQLGPQRAAFERLARVRVVRGCGRSRRDDHALAQQPPRERQLRSRRPGPAARRGCTGSAAELPRIALTASAALGRDGDRAVEQHEAHLVARPCSTRSRSPARSRSAVSASQRVGGGQLGQRADRLGPGAPHQVGARRAGRARPARPSRQPLAQRGRRWRPGAAASTAGSDRSTPIGSDVRSCGSSCARSSRCRTRW